MKKSRPVLDAIGAGLSAAGAALRSSSRLPSTLAEPEDWMRELFAPMTASGVQVSETSAMRLAAHYACVSLVARIMGSFPIHVYESLPDGRKRKAIDHPVYRLVHDRPNPEMTAMSFIESAQANLSNVGRAFAEIVWGRDGYPKELWPLPPGHVSPRRRSSDGVLEYMVDGDVLPSWKILHIPGLGFDGINSFSPVGLFRQTIGLGLAAEEYGARFFGQGTNIGGFIEHPKELSDIAYERLKESLNETYKGLQKSHGLVILEEGSTYSKIGMSMEDAQFIETQKLNRSTIAMIHGVPPHMIGDLEKATFSNIEQQGIEAVIYLFRPWAVRWEQALNARLFTPEEQKRFYVRFNLDALLRGDMKSRYDAYAVGRQWGWLSADDILELEERDPLPEDKGKTYLQPLNMLPAGVAPASRGGQVVYAESPVASQRSFIEERRELCDREAGSLAAALAGAGNLREILNRVQRGLERSVREEIGVAGAMSEAFLADYAEALKRRNPKPDALSVAGELHRMRSAFLRELYRMAGVRRVGLKPGRLFRSVAAGRVVSIDAPFFEKGEELREGSLAVTTEYRVWNPPAFPGDDSEIIPVMED